MDTSASSNAPGFVRIGLVALFFSAAYPVYQLLIGVQGRFDPATLAFRAGFFCVALGVALRQGWVRGVEPRSDRLGAVDAAAGNG